MSIFVWDAHVEIEAETIQDAYDILMETDDVNWVYDESYEIEE